MVPLGTYDENHHSVIDRRLLWEAGKKYHPKLIDLYSKMTVSLALQLGNLHDAECFLMRVKA